MEKIVPIMLPPPGERSQRFVGDCLRFTLRDGAGRALPDGWRARLRTNLGRADILRSEIIEAHTKNLPLAGAAWRDLPMHLYENEWSLELPLTEVGYFKAKAYAVDPRGWQHWPDGPDFGISIHPDAYRTANTIYCAFTRLFGETKTAVCARDEKLEHVLTALDKDGYTVIPPSGKLRNLVQHLPHIFDTLGCRILHLLPVNPTPTGYARFGGFGSPYASLDLTAIDPALIEFDKCTTGVDQFRELTYAVHLRGGRVFLDIVINHTGWGSTLQEKHPEWFVRRADGTFASPGAWDVIWEDLIELKHSRNGATALWDELAETFLIWCGRGVDGFRCDAGYKIPVRAWQYIIARVQQEFPETIFFLEGLGGAWEFTGNLLTDGGMQWAYSELFQNYSGLQVAGYLDHSLKQSRRVGLLVHYSETHDNDRLADPAKGGRAWSLLRNRLCALTSVSGGYGFTCGVEWLAMEKILVHHESGLAWGNSHAIIPELAQLNRLLAEHPCFFDGAKVIRLSPIDSPVLALRRDSEEAKDTVLVLVNNDIKARQSGALSEETARELPEPKFDLLGQALPKPTRSAAGEMVFSLAPGACYCLSPTAKPRGLSGDDYRRARAQSAWAMTVLDQLLPLRAVPIYPWRELAALVDENPARFLAAISEFDFEHSPANIEPIRALAAAMQVKNFPRVVRWRLSYHKRVTLVPLDHWLLIEDTAPFRVTLSCTDGSRSQHAKSISVRAGQIACFAPRETSADAELALERYGLTAAHVNAAIRYLSPQPPVPSSEFRVPSSDDLILLTNGIGGMARLCVDLGRVKSKYDCVLGANLHPAVPVDRHIFAKHIRVWVNADGFISPLDLRNLASFEPGPPAVWHFLANAGDARTVEIQMTASMLDGYNTTVFRFTRPTAAAATGKQLPATADVRLTVRVDIEDRNFHCETKRNREAEHHFSAHTKLLADQIGFSFTPVQDRRLRVFSDSGIYHPAPEWCENIPHPAEQNRGLIGRGDAFSPGWFELPLPRGADVTMVVTAEKKDPAPSEFGISHLQSQIAESADGFAQRLLHAARAFVVRRNGGKTVIAGYPWFLDWGRDTLISARGLLAAGMIEEVKQLLVTFGGFEENGTLPNSISGEDATNRDTSDAPLWFGVVCEDFAARSETRHSFYDTIVDNRSRTIAEVLRSIAENYIRGTANGIRIDPDSALVWSPSHFTWMDTNFPACTPREGYPVEIQALWIRLLRQLERLGEATDGGRWADLANRAETSLKKMFWLEERGYLADVLLAKQNQPAVEAIVDNALRSNYLLAVSFGLIAGEQAQSCVEAALRDLVVPGALRSLAPLPVSPPLAIYGNDGRLLNNPIEPYWGRYEGDEDTHRKPAYHNGTAWTWTLPIFCEALARAWDFSPPAVAAAKAYLGSIDRLIAAGCLGHIPEILDGDAPHTQRGCDAQAWGATEALRVWKLLQHHTGANPAARSIESQPDLTSADQAASPAGPGNYGSS